MRCGRRWTSAMTPKAAATEVVRMLREHKHEAWFVGGCVRDLVLGREPADYDVTTNATPAQVMAIFPKTFAVGIQFGVVLIPFEGTASADDSTFNIEVATFRSDVGYSDGRHPDAV